jgi:hypothetical protein
MAGEQLPITAYDLIFAIIFLSQGFHRACNGTNLDRGASLVDLLIDFRALPFRTARAILMVALLSPVLMERAKVVRRSR